MSKRTRLDEMVAAVLDMLEAANLAGKGVTDTDVRNALSRFAEVMTVAVDHAAIGADRTVMVVERRPTMSIEAQIKKARLSAENPLWRRLKNKEEGAGAPEQRSGVDEVRSGVEMLIRHHARHGLIRHSDAVEMISRVRARHASVSTTDQLDRACE